MLTHADVCWRMQVLHHMDLALTDSLSQWPQARKAIVDRFPQRTGSSAQSELLEAVSSLKDQVNILRLLQHELRPSSSSYSDDDSSTCSTSSEEPRPRMHTGLVST